MRRISSSMTFFYKWVFPIFWFGIVGLVFIALALDGWGSDRSVPVEFLVAPVLMAIIGYFVMKRLVLDLVDEVLDVGDALIIRNRGQEERVALSEIMNVSYEAFMNPRRVTLRLRRPSVFGTQVSFSAPMSLIPFSTSPVIDELIERIDAKGRASR
jgi:hypothetical protein